MSQAIQKLTVTSAAVFAAFAIAWSGAAPAQSVAPSSQQLHDASVSPVPSAYHPRTRQLLVGVRGGVKRMEQAPSGALLDRGTVDVGSKSTVLRLRIDVPRDRLWVLDVGHVHVVDLATNRRIRSIALPNWTYSTHEDLCLPDLQLDEQGAALVSDNVQPKLWRIDPRDFSTIERNVKLDAHRNLDVGFSALAVGERGVIYAAMAAPGLLWRVDSDLSRAENIPLTSRVFGVCALETRSRAGSGAVTLYALSVRDRNEVHRVTVTPGYAAATVTLLPRASKPSRYGGPGSTVQHHLTGYGTLPLD